MSVSVLTAISASEPGLAGFNEAKDVGSGGDNWRYKTCKAPVKSSPPTNQHRTFYRSDALPVAQPILSEALKGKASRCVWDIQWTVVQFLLAFVWVTGIIRKGIQSKFCSLSLEKTHSTCGHIQVFVMTLKGLNLCLVLSRLTAVWLHWVK